MTGARIVLIGAGSTVFTTGVLDDLAGSPYFGDAAVELVDINADAVETMAALGRRLARRRGSQMTVSAHVDRRAALPGADVVVTTIAVGGATGWRHDIDIPARHGIRQTVGDSVGPGGVLRALRHIPELIAIAADIADLAPAARLVNYSNPLTANVRAVTRETSVAVIGLCHGTMHTGSSICADLSLDPARTRLVWAGLNHLCWLLEGTSDGGDIYPALRERVAALAAAPPGTGSHALHRPVSADLLEHFGLYPAPGDRHVAEFFRWYLESGATAAIQTELASGLAETRHYIDGKEDLWTALHEQAAGAAPLPQRLSGQEAERVVTIAERLLGGPDAEELAVNLPNEGAIADLPPEAVVEVPAVIGTSGVRARPVGPLPPAIAAVLASRWAQQELTVSAAVTRSRATTLQALAADPLVPSPAAARRILDDAVIAHRPLLDDLAAGPTRPAGGES